jgi:hypothetical protein
VRDRFISRQAYTPANVARRTHDDIGIAFHLEINIIGMAGTTLSAMIAGDF